MSHINELCKCQILKCAPEWPSTSHWLWQIWATWEHVRVWRRSTPVWQSWARSNSIRERRKSMSEWMSTSHRVWQSWARWENVSMCRRTAPITSHGVWQSWAKWKTVRLWRRSMYGWPRQSQRVTACWDDECQSGPSQLIECGMAEPAERMTECGEEEFLTGRATVILCNGAEPIEGADHNVSMTKCGRQKSMAIQHLFHMWKIFTKACTWRLLVNNCKHD